MTAAEFENDIKDVLPLLEIAIPLAIPGSVIPVDAVKVIAAILAGIQGMANGKIDAATVLAQVNATSGGVAANDAKVDAEVAAEFPKS